MKLLQCRRKLCKGAEGSNFVESNSNLSCPQVRGTKVLAWEIEKYFSIESNCGAEELKFC